MEVVVTTGLLELQVVKSSSHIIITNKPTSSFFLLFAVFLQRLLQVRLGPADVSKNKPLGTAAAGFFTGWISFLLPN